MQKENMNTVYFTCAVIGNRLPNLVGDVLDVGIHNDWYKALDYHRELVEKLIKRFDKNDLQRISSVQNEADKLAFTTIEWLDSSDLPQKPLHLPILVHTRKCQVNGNIEKDNSEQESEKREDLPVQEVKIPDSSKISRKPTNLEDGTLMAFQVSLSTWVKTESGRKRFLTGTYIIGRLDSNNIYGREHITKARKIPLRGVKEFFVPTELPVNTGYFINSRISSCEIDIDKRFTEVPLEVFQVLKEFYLKWEKKYLQKRRYYERKHPTTSWVDDTQWCADPY